MAGDDDEVAAGSSVERLGASTASCPAELVAAMRRLKGWSGLSYRQLESRAARLGLALPRSTLTNALHRETLPREDLLAAFVRACGCGEADHHPPPCPAPRLSRDSRWSAC